MEFFQTVVKIYQYNKKIRTSEKLKIFSQLLLWVAMDKEVCFKLRIIIWILSINHMIVNMPRMSMKNLNLNQLKIIKIKKPNCMKIDNIKFMRKIVIMLQLRKRKKNSK